jgi:D-alanine transaminase
VSIVYLNGEYVPAEEATVSVEDRGFLFADGIYEVVRLYRGRVFEQDAHLQRWARSAEGARLPLRNTLTQLPAILQRLTHENDLQDADIYLQYTRGVAHPRTHAFPAEAHPTLLAMPVALHLPPPEAYAQGMRTIALPDLRWQRCDIKSTMLLPNVMAKQQAREQGAFEAILVRDGVVKEGTSTNILAVFDGQLATHPLDHSILGGITRQVVLRLAEELGIPVREKPFTLEQVYGAQELFLSSTTSEVLPLTRIDGRPVGTGRPGPVTLRLYEAFQKLTAKL